MAKLIERQTAVAEFPGSNTASPKAEQLEQPAAKGAVAWQPTAAAAAIK